MTTTMAMPAEAATTNEQQAGPSQPAKKTAAAKKRKNPSAAAADAPAQPNTLLFGGHIGTTSSHPPPPGWLGAGGGHRRTLPESILPFKLPTRSHGQPIAPAANDDQDSSSSSSSDSDDSDDSDPESSARRKRRRATSAAHRSGMLLNQSLRQSRLFYMASLLPPHSHRTKAGLQFPNSIPEEQLHGMVPAQKGTYNVVPLGKVQLEIDPHLFANTRIFEMTKASLAPPGASGSPPVAGSGGRPTPQGSPKEKGAKKTGPKGGRKSGEPKAPKVSKKDAKAQQQQRQAEQPAPSGMPPHMRPTANASGSGSGSGPSSPLTSPPPADSSPRPPPPQGSTSSSSSNTPQPPTAKQIDPNLVNRVNAKAANDPGLRALLHVAAKGQASPEQLRELGLVIAKVTKEMEVEGFKVQTGMARSPPQSQQGSKPPPPLPKPGGSKEGEDGLGSGKGKAKSKGKGKDKAIKEEQQGGPESGPSSATATESAPVTKPSKPKKAKAAAETSEGAAINTAAAPSSASSGAADRTPAEASATTSSNSTKTTAKSARPAPSTSSSIRPLAVTPTPPPPKPNRPPILIVEFRESLSHRYYLPVHSALVTRTLRRQTPYASTGVREMISGLGDDAEEMDGGEEIEEDGSVRERGGIVDVVETEMKFMAPVRGSDAAQAGAGVGEKGTRGFPVTIRFTAVAPSKDEFRRGQGQQQEQQHQTLAALWEAVGRVPGVTTIGGEEEESKGLNHQEEVKVKEEGNDAAAKADLSEPPPITQASSESRSMDVDRPTAGEAEKDDLSRAEGDEQEEAQRRALELKARHEAEIQRQREVARKEADDLVRREKEHVATLERALSAALSHLPAPLALDWSKPLPPGLEPHLTDNFAPQLGSSVQFGIAGQVDGRRKNTSINASASVPQLLGADEDLEVDGDMTIASASSFSQDVSHPPIPTGLTRSGKPKRRPRPVATHNADGSLKRCSACGTSTTPMWRRGPLGVGTLCNACGARWRAGRGGDWEASARAGAKGVGGGGGGGGGGGSDVPPSQEVGGEKEGDDEQMEGQPGVVGAEEAEQGWSRR